MVNLEGCLGGEDDLVFSKSVLVDFVPFGICESPEFEPA